MRADAFRCQNHQMPNTDTQLATLGAMAQLAMDMHTDDGDTRDTIIENLTTIHMRDPEGAAQLLSVAIWLIAQNMCADDVDADGGAEAEPAPAADPEFGQHSLDIRYGVISLACDGREVATYSSGTPVAVIVDRVLEDMVPAEPEPVPPPGIVHGTISGPDGRLEIIVAPDWFDHLGSPSRLLRAHQMREQAAALLRVKPDLAGKTIDVEFDPEHAVLLGWKLSEDGKAAGDENPFVDAGAVAAEMGALSDDLDAAGEALKTPQDELAARLDQIRTGEIRFPDSWKQPMPKLAEGGVIKSGEPYLVGEGNVAPQKDSEEPGDE